MDQEPKTVEEKETKQWSKKKLWIVIGVVVLVILLVPIMVFSPVISLLFSWMHDDPVEEYATPTMEQRFDIVQNAIITTAELNGHHAIYVQDESGNDMFRIYMTDDKEPADSILVNVVVDDESKMDDTFSITYSNQTTWEDMDLNFMIDLANSISEKAFSVGDLRSFLKDNTQKYYQEGSKYKYKHLDFFEHYGYQYLSEETIRHNQSAESDFQDGVITPPELILFGLIKE